MRRIRRFRQGEFFGQQDVSNLSPPARKKLGDNIRRVRAARGMTQQRLAEGADLNIRNVQRIEAGEFDVSLRTAVRLRKALDCSWEDLLPKEWL